MVFDTHPCATQGGAQRVYDGSASAPVVCTANEYSDIFALAADALNYPFMASCCTTACSGPRAPNYETFLQSLRQKYSHLAFRLTPHQQGCRYILVLSIQQQGGSQQANAANRQGILPFSDAQVPSREPLPMPIPVPATQSMTGRY